MLNHSYHSYCVKQLCTSLTQIPCHASQNGQSSLSSTLRRREREIIEMQWEKEKERNKDKREQERVKMDSWRERERNRNSRRARGRERELESEVNSGHFSKVILTSRGSEMATCQPLLQGVSGSWELQLSPGGQRCGRAPRWVKTSHNWVSEAQLRTSSWSLYIEGGLGNGQ